MVLLIIIIITHITTQLTHFIILCFFLIMSSPISLPSSFFHVSRSNTYFPLSASLPSSLPLLVKLAFFLCLRVGREFNYPLFLNKSLACIAIQFYFLLVSNRFRKHGVIKTSEATQRKDPVHFSFCLSPLPETVIFVGMIHRRVYRYFFSWTPSRCNVCTPYKKKVRNNKK